LLNYQALEKEHFTTSSSQTERSTSQGQQLHIYTVV